MGMFNHKIPPEIPPDLCYFQNCVYQSSSHLPKWPPQIIFFCLVQPDIYLPKSLHRFFPLKMPMGPWKSKKVLTDSIAHFTFYFGPFSTSRGNYAFLRGKNYAATWAGVYVVGLSKKNDLGWSFRQMRAGSVDFFLKMITNRGVFCGQIPPALKK